MSSVSIAGNTSGSVTLSAPDVAGNTTLTLPTTSGTVVTDANINTYAPNTMKNRIINGDMRIDQRNAGAAVTTPDVYTVDRWIQYQGGGGAISWQQSSTAPTGFNYSLAATVTTADTSLGTSDYYFLRQFIEGYNVADLDFGTANAKTVTLSFWVRSSLTGTFGGCLQNGGVNRFYPFTYTISSANTWEQKTVTIAGDTSGTWLKTNGAGLGVTFSLGFGTNFIGTAGAWTSSSHYTATGATSVVGTNGATWYVTGVQLEVGTSATPFERRLYGQELALCQRYFITNVNSSSGAQLGSGYATSTTNIDTLFPTPVVMRTTPSITVTANLRVRGNAQNITPSGQTVNSLCASGVFVSYTVSGATQYQTYIPLDNGAFLSAEL